MAKVTPFSKRMKLSERTIVKGVAVTALALQSMSAQADIAGLPLHGFADVMWGRASKGQPVGETTRGFRVGNLDFYLNPQFGDNVKALIELNFDPSLTTQQINTDTERFQLGYTFSDALTAWVGRFHTPMGFWNTAYHHGAILNPSVYRPRFLDFEDHAGSMPVHMNGLWLTGGTKFETGRLMWDGYVGNGNRIQGADPNAPGSGTIDFNLFNDDNYSVAFGGRLSFAFSGALDGLTLGVHGMSNEIDSYQNSPVGNPTGTASNDPNNPSPFAHSLYRFYGGYGVYENHGVELISEFYRFANKNQDDIGSNAHMSWAGFTHLGYEVISNVTPYTRYERTHYDQTDSYFANITNGSSYQRWVGGVRYDISARAAIKGEYNHTTFYDGNANVNAGAVNEGRFQYAISF